MIPWIICEWTSWLYIPGLASFDWWLSAKLSPPLSHQVSKFRASISLQLSSPFGDNSSSNYLRPTVSMKAMFIFFFLLAFHHVSAVSSSSPASSSPVEVQVPVQTTKTNTATTTDAQGVVSTVTSISTGTSYSMSTSMHVFTIPIVSIHTILRTTTIDGIVTSKSELHVLKFQKSIRHQVWKIRTIRLHTEHD